MSLPLLPAERAQYSAIIDGILASSDLQTISSKQIRKNLQQALQHDISEKKDAVQKLILERFDHANNAAAAAEAPIPTTEPEPPATNGHIKAEHASHTRVKDESTPPSSRAISTPSASASASVAKSEPESDSDSISPPKKKRKQTSKQDSDAKLAAMLQAQENSRVSRSTRGGGNKKVVKKTPKKPRKKSEKKVRAEDDSEIEVGSDGEVKEKVRKGGFHKLYHLSAPLADLVGEPTLSRPQTVKKIWEYIKARDLQDPNDKRQIRCDEKMQLVFKQDKVHMFTMNKILGKQLYDVEEE
ncbi:SWIB-domain-containing protein [Hyaloscypha variabilis F]|uniref:SWIB-domain-containing protein n=1 Tax=Hyaloscypha variabilis (strain UAMH 11265 / GT02V1 / F) TaxID=1149755 RepID=A0A2J6RLU9_HYAVF|nr:SWIB-domain-containing protein [Hyaloscypha variabilis F]